MSITSLTLLMVLLTAQGQEGQEELAYFEEPRRALELITVLDLRYIQADSTASWLDAELGKARYGGDGRDGRSLFRIPQASIVFNTRATGSLFTHVHVNLDLEPEHPGGRYGWDRIRLVEAFADWRWNFAPPLELRVKGSSPNFPVKSPYGSPGSVKLLVPPTCFWGGTRFEVPRFS